MVSSPCNGSIMAKPPTDTDTATQQTVLLLPDISRERCMEDSSQAPELSHLHHTSSYPLSVKPLPAPLSHTPHPHLSPPHPQYASGSITHDQQPHLSLQLPWQAGVLVHYRTIPTTINVVVRHTDLPVVLRRH